MLYVCDYKTSLRRLSNRKPIDVYAVGRYGERARSVAEGDLFDADLRLLADVVSSIKALCGQLPKRRWAGQVYARDV